jgi:Domain of unknown function (DUF4129)
MQEPAVTGSYWAGPNDRKPPVTSAEEHATQPPTRRLAWPAGYTRPVLAGLLVIIVLAGIRDARPAVTGTGPWQRDVLPLAGALEFVLAVLLGTLWLIARRRPRPGYPADLLRAGLLRAIPLSMVAVAVLAAVSRLALHPGRRTPAYLHSTLKPAAPRAIKGAATSSSVSLTYVLYALLALVLLAAIVACILIILRRIPAGSAEAVLRLPDDDESLRDAIESGRRALRSFDDAQAAIIACYVAMEASLASAGAAREVAETPDELLGRAIGSGLLQGGAAGRLTVLFYEARYSSHALPATARDEAVEALDAISAELAGRADDSRLSGTSAPGAAP